MKNIKWAFTLMTCLLFPILGSAETEFKLLLAPEHYKKLKDQLTESDQFNKPVIKKHFNVYYDSPDGLKKWSKEGIKIRIRYIDNHPYPILTIKGHRQKSFEEQQITEVFVKPEIECQLGHFPWSEGSERRSELVNLGMDATYVRSLTLDKVLSQSQCVEVLAEEDDPIKVIKQTIEDHPDMVVPVPVFWNTCERLDSFKFFDEAKCILSLDKTTTLPFVHYELELELPVSKESDLELIAHVRKWLKDYFGLLKIPYRPAPFGKRKVTESIFLNDFDEILSFKMIYPYIGS